MELDGRPLDEVWDETFHKLFADLDRDGDGFLSREEARRAPSALRVRQLSWGLFFAAPAAPPWEELDRHPADGKVSFDEFADYYQRHGVGGVQVAVGRTPATDALTDALLRRLDRDGDGRVSKAEWQAAADSLHALDLNDDELISGDELVPGLTLPRRVRRHAADAPVAGPCRRRACSTPSPSRRLPGGGDGDADHALVVRLGRRHAADAVLLDLGRAVCDVRTGDSRLTADFASACKLARERFAEADADHDGRLDRGEAERSSFAPLRDLFDAADRDGDGRVSAEEWSAYLDLQARLVEGQVVLTILDHGRGLFELLDADRDGVLSVRELRSAWTRLDAAGCLRDGALDRSRLPRQLRCVVSRGRPRADGRRSGAARPGSGRWTATATATCRAANSWEPTRTSAGSTRTATASSAPTRRNGPTARKSANPSVPDCPVRHPDACSPSRKRKRRSFDPSLTLPARKDVRLNPPAASEVAPPCLLATAKSIACRSPVAGWSKPSVAACRVMRFAPLASGIGRPWSGRS